jgi:hypothetical protein
MNIETLTQEYLDYCNNHCLTPKEYPIHQYIRDDMERKNFQYFWLYTQELKKQEGTPYWMPTRFL